MTNRVVHYAIPIDYWTMDSGGGQGPGADGALTPRAESPEGVVVYVGVPDIEEAMRKVTDAGGTLPTEKMPISTMGWMAKFRDTEGNQVGLFQEGSAVPMPEGTPGG